jgi:hypothetical protein
VQEVFVAEDVDGGYVGHVGERVGGLG